MALKFEVIKELEKRISGLIKNLENFFEDLPEIIKACDEAIQKNLKKTDEKPLSVTTRLDKPGWAHIYCTFKDSKGKTYRREVMWRGKKEIRNVSGGIGGMAEPHKIDIAIKEPADFDEFWSNIRKNVLAQPIEELEKVDVTPKKQQRISLFMI